MEWYCRLDVILLAVLIERFKMSTSHLLKIHMEHYLTLPSFAYSAMTYILTKDKVFPELISDEGIYRFIERGKRGGAAGVLNSRFVISSDGESAEKLGGDISDFISTFIPDACGKKGSWKELRDTLDVIHQILYLDVNALYGSCQSLTLPLDKYKWGDDCEVDVLNSLMNVLRTHKHVDVESCSICNCKWEDWFRTSGGTNIEGNNVCWSDDSSVLYSETGFFLEVDISYTEEVRERLKYLPPYVCHKDITLDDLSPFNKKALNGGRHTRSKKLVFTLENVSDQVIHVKYALFLARLGVTILVKKAVKFRESKFLLPFVNILTEARKQASMVGDVSSVKIYKLCLNAVYGKTLEVKDNRTKCSIITSREQQMMAFADPALKRFIALSSTVLIVEKEKKNVLLDSPIAIGVAILDFAKITMFSFFYCCVERLFGFGNAIPLYSDTDSFIISIKGESRNDIIKQLSPYMDLSNYPKDHPLYCNKNEKRPFFMKDEMAGASISFFICVKSKVYAVGCVDGKVIVRMAGVQRSIPDMFSHVPYILSVLNGVNFNAAFKSIKSAKHSIHITDSVKSILHSFDDKVFVLDCGIHVKFYGERYNDGQCNCGIKQCQPIDKSVKVVVTR